TVPGSPQTPLELDTFRARADCFIAALDEEYYLHFAGHKDSLELEDIYEEFADLTTLEQARSLGETAAADGGGARELWRFASEQYMGNLTREHAAARNALTDEHLNPVYLEAADIEQQATEALGAATYRDLYLRFGFRLD